MEAFTFYLQACLHISYGCFLNLIKAFVIINGTGLVVLVAVDLLVVKVELMVIEEPSKGKVNVVVISFLQDCLNGGHLGLNYRIKLNIN